MEQRKPRVPSWSWPRSLKERRSVPWSSPNWFPPAPMRKKMPSSSNSIRRLRPKTIWIRKAPTKTLSGRSPRNRRSEEHTSELQSRLHLVCRLLLEKKKKKKKYDNCSIKGQFCIKGPGLVEAHHNVQKMAFVLYH